MKKLTHDDLLSLEQYALDRPAFRARVMAHKKNRIVRIGPHGSLQFEDRLTIQYQIQEMLRAERIFERPGIEAELAVYNPMIPDGGNLKATMMLEYEDPEERQRALAGLVGIEHCVWLRAAGYGQVVAIADEDLDRSTAEKTSAVHFLRFECTAEMRAALRRGAALAAGVEHPAYRHAIDPIAEAVRVTLIRDFA